MSFVPPDAGALNRRLVLEAAKLVPDGQGGGSESFEPVGRLWASLDCISETREDLAGAPSIAVSYRVVLRHRRDIVPGMRLSGPDGRMLVEAVRDPDGSRRFLLCLCREVLP